MTYRKKLELILNEAQDDLQLHYRTASRASQSPGKPYSKRSRTKSRNVISAIPAAGKSKKDKSDA